MKKSVGYYHMMHVEAKRGYEHFGDWDWTITTYWGEDETRNTIKDVEKVTASKEKDVEIWYKLGIITKEKYEFEKEVHKQIRKFIGERKRILNIK